MWASRSQDLPTIDEATIPVEPKTTQDPAPVRENPLRNENRSPIDENDAPSGPSNSRVNTTTFHYLPDVKDSEDYLPNIEESDQENDEEEAEEKRRRWLEAGLCYPDKDGNGQRWYGAYLLGQGATGRVGLWVGSDDTKVIQDVSQTVLTITLLTSIPETCCERHIRQ